LEIQILHVAVNAVRTPENAVFMTLQSKLLYGKSDIVENQVQNCTK
jgi:hypothetical protein